MTKIRFNNTTTNLTLLIEGSSKIQYDTCKILRFGIGSYDPRKSSPISNRAKLIQDVGGLLAVIEILQKQGVLPQEELLEAKEARLEKLQNWYEGKGTYPDDLV